jgi:uncharacterized damage-inducible protein DinB
VKSEKISSNDTGKEFIKTARRHLVEEYLPKIRSCVHDLTEDEVWWRAHETDNSVGNLLLHLNGNMRQWIISGIGGKTYERDRPKEFSERTNIPKHELLAMFESTVMEVDETLATFDVSKLTEVRHFQKWDYSCLYAVSHVVEHVAQHMGQIIYITKLKKGVDLKFFNL